MQSDDERDGHLNAHGGSLLHVKCLKGTIGFDQEEHTFHNKIICTHCGLPLSKNHLRKWDNPNSSGYFLLTKILTDAEREKINDWVLNQSFQQFRHAFWDIDCGTTANFDERSLPIISSLLENQIIKQVPIMDGKV